MSNKTQPVEAKPKPQSTTRRSSPAPKSAETFDTLLHAEPNPDLQRAQTDPQMLEARQVLRLQRSVGNRAVNRLLARQLSTVAQSSEMVQRLVLPLSQDEMTQGTYQNLTKIEAGYTDPTNSLRPVDTSVSGLPLAQLGPTEALHVIIHNAVAEDLALVDGTELFNTLVQRGLTPDKTGTIRLISCESGTEYTTSDGATTVARELKKALAGHGYSNPVIGFKGLVRAGQGAAIYVIPSAKASEFWRLKRLKEAAENKALQAVEQDDNEQQNKYMTLVEKLETQIGALWERQSMATIEHIP